MSREELLRALRKLSVETGSLACQDSATGASVGPPPAGLALKAPQSGASRSPRAELNCAKPLDAALRNHGCGYEHNCSLHGCAVIREAVEILEEDAHGN